MARITNLGSDGILDSREAPSKKVCSQVIMIHSSPVWST